MSEPDYKRLAIRIIRLDDEPWEIRLQFAERALRDVYQAGAKRMVDAGRGLATCAFNLKQRDHLTDRERRSLAESQERWDLEVKGFRLEAPEPGEVLRSLGLTKETDDA